MTGPTDDPRTQSPGPRTRWLRRLAPLLTLAALAALVIATGWHRQLSLETLVRHREILDAFVATHRVMAITAFMALYVAVAALSIPGAVYLTIASGILFGVVTGGLASIVGATVGGTLVFLIARTALGEPIARRAGPLTRRLAEGFRQDAFSYLLLLRLVPVFPFFLVNLVPALAGVGLLPFVAATALGIVPAAFAFAFLGAGLDSVIAAQKAAYEACLASDRHGCRLEFDLWRAVTPELMAALAVVAVVALIPIVVRHMRARRMCMPRDG